MVMRVLIAAPIIREKLGGNGADQGAHAVLF
jgi:hypothetical protein